MTSRELVYEQTTPAGIVKPAPEELSVPEPRSGPAAAVVLAAGIGCFTLGLLYGPGRRERPRFRGADAVRARRRRVGPDDRDRSRFLRGLGSP